MKNNKIELTQEVYETMLNEAFQKILVLKDQQVTKVVALNKLIEEHDDLKEEIFKIENTIYDRKEKYKESEIELIKIHNQIQQELDSMYNIGKQFFTDEKLEEYELKEVTQLITNTLINLRKELIERTKTRDAYVKELNDWRNYLVQVKMSLSEKKDRIKLEKENLSGINQELKTQTTLSNKLNKNFSKEKPKKMNVKKYIKSKKNK